MNGSAKFAPNIHILLIPIGIVQMVLVGTGTGIIISALTTKYRDLAMLVSFGLELWKYATPIAYGLKLIPEKYLGIYMLNPVTSIITTFRYGFFGVGFFRWEYYVISWITTILLFVAGMLLFNKIERTFMDTV